jgi:hypothetical protein
MLICLGLMSGFWMPVRFAGIATDNNAWHHEWLYIGVTRLQFAVFHGKDRRWVRKARATYNSFRADRVWGKIQAQSTE